MGCDGRFSSIPVSMKQGFCGFTITHDQTFAQITLIMVAFVYIEDKNGGCAVDCLSNWFLIEWVSGHWQVEANSIDILLRQL